jgi:hypothetical protein
MEPPRTFADFKILKGDALLAAVWDLIAAQTSQHSPRGDGRSRVDLQEVLHRAYGVTLDELAGMGLRAYVLDEFATLVERGFLWFNKWAEGSTAGAYELTPKGRSATREMVLSGWPDGRMASVRLRDIEGLDETLAAYFRMAIRTYEAGVHEAAIFLIGGAYERLVALVGGSLESMLPPNWARKKLAQQIDDVADLFRKQGRHSDAELLELAGHSARWSRNEVGHPRDVPPAASPEFVASRLMEFPVSARTLLDAGHELLGT